MRKLSSVILDLLDLHLDPKTRVYFVRDKPERSVNPDFLIDLSCDYCWIEDLYSDSFSHYYYEKFVCDVSLKCVNLVRFGDCLIFVYRKGK